MAGPELHCIDLDLMNRPGFRRFMSAWLYRDRDLAFLVDPGPLATTPHLLAELRRLAVDRLDYILLTHIHIDHAGGTAAVLEHYPDARVICHPDGIRHLVDPARLWQGSRSVLGTLADDYGEILPVAAGRIAFAAEIGTSGLRAFLTPGHAPHHCCYLLGDLLFAGEVAGVRCDVANGIYLRPATPPKFLLDVARTSIEQMLALEPRRMVFAHYGLVATAMDHLRIARDQLGLWVDGVRCLQGTAADDLDTAFFHWLLDHDPNFGTFVQLPPDIRARERQFLGNSLRGMQEYVTTTAS
ncbi:MAG: MBL fold metallo-hydrolase [Desulfuromonadales bacterium]|nr:MBL fold metallo-hydrolase [Desulfuromonadales bacterium]